MKVIVLYFLLAAALVAAQPANGSKRKVCASCGHASSTTSSRGSSLDREMFVDDVPLAMDAEDPMDDISIGDDDGTSSDHNDDSESDDDEGAHGLTSNQMQSSPTTTTFSDKVIQSRRFPKKLVMIMVLLCATAGGLPMESVASVELFAGVHSVTQGIRAHGLPAVSVDFSTVDYDDDLNTSAGFLRALWYVMNLRPDGLCVFSWEPVTIP